jgi:hypothetical protein
MAKPASASKTLNQIRWSKTTKAERAAHSKMMHAAKKKKLDADVLPEAK